MDTKLFGRKQAGGMFSIVDREVITGSCFWVGSTVTGASDSTGYGQNPDRPFATLDYAIGKCTASVGDVIYLLPGHAESIASATGAVMDIAGVSVIGLGSGALMPKLSLITAAGSTLSVTAASCTVKNVHICSYFTNGVTAGLTAAATAGGLTLDRLKFTETVNTQEFLIGISIAADCDDVIIRNCRYIGAGGGSTTSFVAAAGGTDRTIVENNFFTGDASAAAVKLDAAASADLYIVGNRLINIDTSAGLGIAVHASSTGFADANDIVNLTDTVAGITGAGLSFGLNRYSNAVNASTRLVPAVDT